jgi:hypothetical protein
VQADFIPRVGLVFPVKMKIKHPVENDAQGAGDSFFLQVRPNICQQIH